MISTRKAGSVFLRLGAGRLHVCLLTVLIAVHLGLLLASLSKTSVTSDEASHLAIGYGYLDSGNSDWLLLNPPLQRSLAAIPLFFRSVNFDAASPGHPVDFWFRGLNFMNQNRDRYHGLFMSGRAVVCILSGCTALLVYLLAAKIQDRRAGVIALFLYCLSPALLAHGGLVTTDLSAATAGVAMVTGVLHYRSRQTLPALVLAGFSFSLLFVSKFNALIFLPAGLLLLTFPPRHVGVEEIEEERPRHIARTALDIAAVLFISWLVLCGFYLFQGVFLSPSNITLSSPLLGRINSLPDWLRIPLPAAYIKAMDLQFSDVLGAHQSYLFGLREPSFWYFPACLLFKASMPVLFLFVAGVVTRDSRRLIWAVFPAVFFLLFMSAVTDKQMGIRMILPALPFMFVCGGCPAARLWEKGREKHKLLLRFLVLALLGWHAAYAIFAYPHYISAFNELAGGPSLPHHGHRFLADSNLDWGQDWIRLKKWQEKNNVDNLSLAWFGIVDPAVYGVTYEPDDCRLKPGYLAVSANLVLGIDPYRKQKCYTRLKKRGPIEKVGASVWVYRINQ
ncbi:MAG: glycosyltransferase family 39 protein [bacterium]